MEKIKLNKFNVFCLILDLVTAVTFYFKSKKAIDPKKARINKFISIGSLICFFGNIFLEMECDFKPLVDDEEEDEELSE